MANETLTFSDYITTNTVMQALNGAKDVAQVGAVEVVRYVQIDAMLTSAALAIGIVVLTSFAAAATWLSRRNEDPDLRIVLPIFVIVIWLFVSGIMLYKLSEQLPMAINPAGSIIYDFVKGGIR